MKVDLKIQRNRRLLMTAVCAGLLVAGAGLAWRAMRADKDAYFVRPAGGAEAINRALAKCATHGGEVRLSAGEYLCAEPIIIRTDHITLRGAGAATQLKLAAGANCPVLIIGDEAKDPRREVTGISVSDLVIDGDREHQQLECWGGVCDSGGKAAIRACGIVVRRAVDVAVEHVSISRCRSGGMVTEKGCRHVVVRGLVCSDNEFDGLACYETQDSVMTNIFLHDNKAAGISADIHFNGNIIANAMLAGNGTQGIFMRDSHRNLMQGIIIRDSGKQGIFLDQVDKRADTGASGNSFIGIIVERSKGAAVHINEASCKPTLFSGCQYFDNEGGDFETHPGVAKTPSNPAEASPALKEARQQP